MKKILKLLEWISPKITARLCYYKLCHPQKIALKTAEVAILKKAVRKEKMIEGHKVNCYTWGIGAKKALLVHGWEGKAANFGNIIKELLQKDYTIESFDAPGHGNNSQTKVSFYDFSDVLENVLQEDVYDLIVTHSFGSIISFYVMDKINYSGNHLIAFTTPDKFDDYVENTIKYFGLSSHTKKELINLIKVKMSHDPLTLNASNFVSNFSLTKVNFIHDKNDRVVPIKWTRNVHDKMKNSSLFELENTGHHKILWAPQTMKLLQQII